MLQGHYNYFSLSILSYFKCKKQNSYKVLGTGLLLLWEDFKPCSLSKVANSICLVEQKLPHHERHGT